MQTVCLGYNCKNEDESFIESKSKVDAAMHYLYRHLTVTVCSDCFTIIPVMVLGTHQVAKCGFDETLKALQEVYNHRMS